MGGGSKFQLQLQMLALIVCQLERSIHICVKTVSLTLHLNTIILNYKGN
jgi:hypothetical protein